MPDLPRPPDPWPIPPPHPEPTPPPRPRPEVPPRFVRIRIGVVVLTVGAAVATVGFGDRLRPTDTINFNSTTSEKGVLINGVKGFGGIVDWFGGNTFFYDQLPVISAATTAMTIGNFIPSPAPYKDEVVAFTPGKAPFIKANFAWTYWFDTVDVQFQGPYPISIVVWLLTNEAYQNKFSAIKNNEAGNDCQKARDIWSGEGQGIQLSCDVQDGRNFTIALTDPLKTDTAEKLFENMAFDCERQHAADLTSSPNPPYRAGVLNVYYVNEVQTVLGSGSNYGVFCSPDVIVLGSEAHETLLAHELGHALMGDGVGDHVDPLSPSICDTMNSTPPTPCSTPIPACGPTACLFDRTNVMHGASSLRQSLTEGQLFRAFFNRSSVLNNTAMYNSGMGITLGRLCGGISVGATGPIAPTQTSICPFIHKRIWPDDGGEYGPWPVN